MIQAFLLCAILAVLASIPAFALFHCAYPQAPASVQICFGFISLVCFGISAMFAPMAAFGFFKGSTKKQSLIMVYVVMVLATFLLPLGFVILMLLKLFKKNRNN